MNIGTPPGISPGKARMRVPSGARQSRGPLTGLAHLTGGGLPSALAARLMSHSQTEQA